MFSKDAAERKKLHRKALLAGAVISGVLSLVISILMDFMVSDALQGTWRDAIVSDLHRFFSVTVPPDGFTAYALFGVILIILAVIGGGIGAVFSYIVFRFLEMLTS